MSTADDKLAAIAKQLKTGLSTPPETVRAFLGWFGAARRGWRVEEDFVDSIRKGAPVRLTDFARGVGYMRVTEAIWRSWSADGARTTV